MSRKLAVIPERCSGCKTCEVVCSIARFGVNNPKKSCVRVMVVYPHPVIRMPTVCSQCKQPKCADSCPAEAIVRRDGVVEILEENCVACQACVESCPFGAIFVHDDIDMPFKCNHCDGDPECVKACPKQALAFIPEHVLGQAHRLTNVLNYAHMREVEYVEKGERKRLRYAEIEGEANED